MRSSLFSEGDCDLGFVHYRCYLGATNKVWSKWVLRSFRVETQRWLDYKRSLCFVHFQWTAAPLIDNLPIDNYHYLVTVHTGVGKEAGTTSNVSLVMSGELVHSGVRKLSDGTSQVNSTGVSVCQLDLRRQPFLLEVFRCPYPHPSAMREGRW